MQSRYDRTLAPCEPPLQTSDPRPFPTPPRSSSRPNTKEKRKKKSIRFVLLVEEEDRGQQVQEAEDTRAQIFALCLREEEDVVDLRFGTSDARQGAAQDRDRRCRDGAVVKGNTKGLQELYPVVS